ncbi:Serine hydrolase FSH [Penicillium malachiteum]|uniref:Serine hydrolase FSH n=1 Tax=Penicillium malachiteum TaxID=1324776 RepID=UPI002546AD82|nr:Serine hydrolase FSH [Penicillium malachiteum]KAJ5725082.1 Serine hydrolase FSH [Penicillium malachiteum]
MNWRKRLGVSIIFGFGLLACISAAFRLETTVKHGKAADAIWTLAPLAFWATAEMTCGFFIVSLPCIPKILKETGAADRLKKMFGVSAVNTSQRNWPSEPSSYKANRGRLGGTTGSNDYYQLDPLKSTASESTEYLHKDGDEAGLTGVAPKIREALDDHEFVFIDGTILTEPFEGSAIITENSESYGYMPAVFTAASQGQDLVSRLVDYIHTQGPFDGVMGFSEGGIIAAMLLIEDARHSFAEFKCGIFFSAALPLDPDVVRTGVLRCINPDTDGILLHVPTALIVEENLVRLRDRSPLAPFWYQEDAQEALVQICDESLREVVRLNLGHQVPGYKSSEGLRETLQAIERTIERADELFD